MVEFVVLYVLGFIMSHGLQFGYFQNNWPTLAKEDYWDDLIPSILLSFMSWVMVLLFTVWVLVGGKKFSFKLY